MPIQVTPSNIPDVLIIEPKVYGDDRGFFYEAFNQRDFSSVIGQQITFVQDNHSKSKKGVLRGLHYQSKHTQGKLVRVINGSVFDVAVDLRQSSSTYAQWVGVELSSNNHKQLWVPEGFAHGFLVVSEEAEFLYKTTDFYYPEYEECLLWQDPFLNIDWPDVGVMPILAEKDRNGITWFDAKKF